MPYIHAYPVTELEVGPLLYRQLGSICPGGKRTNTFVLQNLPTEDDRIVAAMKLLDSVGKLRIKAFVRKYKNNDLVNNPFIELLSADDVYTFALRHNKCLVVMPHCITQWIDLGIDWRTGAMIISRKLRSALESAGVNVQYRDIYTVINAETSLSANFYEVIPTLTIGEFDRVITDIEILGHKAPLLPGELYIDSRSFENHHYIVVENPGKIRRFHIVSQRFYNVCCKLGLSAEWLPVNG